MSVSEPDYLDLLSEEMAQNWWLELNRDRLRIDRLLRSLMPKLAVLAKLPAAKENSLFIFVRGSLHHAWDLHHQKNSTRLPNNLTKAAGAMRVVMDALYNLDDKERDLVASELDGEPEDYFTGEMSDLADALDRASRMAAAAPKRSGRPRGKVNASNEKLRSFIVDFYRGVVVGCSGKLSLDPKNGGRGKLIQALRLIEPCLPPRFLPKSLSAKSVDRWIRPLKRTTPKTPKD